MNSHDKESTSMQTESNTTQIRKPSTVNFFFKYKKRIIFFAILLMFLSIVFVAGQLAQTFELIIPGTGRYVVWSVLAISLIFIIYTTFKLITLPPALVPPDINSSIEKKMRFRKYQLRRLYNNNQISEVNSKEIKKILIRQPSGSIEEMFKNYDELAIQTFDDLDNKAKKIINHSARNIGIATAVSQNGTIDAFVVMGIQIKMIYNLARLYYSKPKPTELINLYLFVGGSAFFAYKAEGGIKKLLETISDVPMVRILAGSVINGSTNFLLTKRIGYLARQYCKAGHSLDGRQWFLKALDKTKEWTKEWTAQIKETANLELKDGLKTKFNQFFNFKQDA